MNHERVVREAVREYNAELATKGWVAIAMGVLTSLLVYVCILLICFFLFCLSGVPWYLVGTVIFGVFFVSSWWSCSRGAGPDEGIGTTPLDEDDLGAMKLAAFATGLPVSPRHTVAGLAGLVMHGPASIIEGRAMLAGMLPGDEVTIRWAGAVLAGMIGEDGVGKAKAIDEINSKGVAVVLVRSGLARPERKGSTNLVATMKAKEGERG